MNNVNVLSFDFIDNKGTSAYAFHIQGKANNLSTEAYTLSHISVTSWFFLEDIMEENKDITLSRKSGQRERGDRRCTCENVDSHSERRSGYDRRQKWPIINEWSSPLSRNEQMDMDK